MPNSNDSELSGDGTPPPGVIHGKQEEIMTIITYVGAGVAVLGACLTLLSYIGFRKFHIKRPHIVMVNLCFCLFLYYLAYLISNPARQSRQSFDSDICIFGAIVCQFAVLAAWFWILVYWTLVLVKFQRPMGGHISHFFIKASFPSYGVPLIITIVCAVVAHVQGDMEGEYYGTMCFVHNMYLHLGAILPIVIALIPMLIIFALLLRGVLCEKEERLKSSNTRNNIKRHLQRLTIITLLWATVTVSSFVHHDKGRFVTMIVFGVVSSLLGLALMVLFCLHHEEIRDHWMSVIRGEDPSMRKHSVSRGLQYDVGELPSSRKSSALKGNPPSMYIEPYDNERKSSTYRIVAKEDTDMSTLEMIQIPGTPTPSRANDANDNNLSAEGKKIGRKKSDATKLKYLYKDGATQSPRQRPEGLDDSQVTEACKSGNKKSHSSSTPPPSPRHKPTKRQQTADAIMTSTSSPTDKKRPSKSGGKPAHRLSRLARKSTASMDEEARHLTEL